MKKALLLFLVLSLFFGFYPLFSRKQGFSIQKVLSRYPPSKRWECALPSSEIASLFDYPFTYLGSGNHTYVFLSHDGRHVLKLFKQKHMRVQELFLSKERKVRRAKQREKSYSSYKVAFDILREETALSYLHLTKTNHLNLTLTLIDQKGRTHKLKADDMEFLIQKKAVLTFRYIEELAEKGDEEMLLDALLSLLQVAKSRSLKGLGDRDMQFFKNFGFIEGKAVEIDSGEFYFEEEKSSSEGYKAELKVLSCELLSWIDRKAPHLRKAFLSRLEDL